MKRITIYILFCITALTVARAQESFLNLVPTTHALVASIPDDSRVVPARGTASNAQSGEGITRAYDGDMTTLYHSSWSNTTFPVTLNFMFDRTVSRIDYLVYYPRTSGSNGNIKAFELWYSLRDDGRAMQKYGDFDWDGRGQPSLLAFDSPLLKPDTIRFVVKSGVNNFVSCAEMEFYESKAQLDLSSLTNIFADPLCSELNPGITAAEIAALPNPFFRQLASDLLSGVHDKEFRIQEFRAWVYPDKKAAQNKTWAYSLRDNPAGIYVSQGEDLIVLVGDTHGQSLSLLTTDLTTGGFGTQKSYILKQGLNKIRMTANGLVYVQYYNDLGASAPKVKIHFATGAVNGYFDSQKHQSSDWSRLLNRAVAPDFDVLGQFIHLTFPVANFKKNLTDGKAYIDNWDQLVRYEHEFMGLYKYPGQMYTNRVYGHADYNPDASFMYASSYHTGYSPGTWNEMTSPNWHKTSVWGPAHEVGHVNQVRPDVEWLGMTEVTNNIYSLHVQTSFGNPSRLQTDGTYAKAFAAMKPGVAHQDVDIWYQLVPFWQLKLYLHDVLGKEDFYKDLFYYFMTHPSPTEPATDGRYQLNFVRKACDIAQLDLTEFFDYWGFLTPVDKMIADYSDPVPFIVTQAQIDALKAEIAAKNYPKPPKNFTGITDSNKDIYK
ncbi:MAG: M60 family metallopeptidase [Dysgonamonadaceae bacterium]|jgi:hypothetical protein|nr:M60 family metallopeptidase [Dysgonamonadaceae bacterium]